MTSLYKNLTLTAFLIFAFAANGVFAQNAAAVPDYYDDVPDVANCKAGKLKDAEKQKVLEKVNYLRSLHGLKPVEYKYSDDFQTEAAALIVVANQRLSHTPTSDFFCYSKDGYDGASSSNLHIFIASSSSMAPTSESSVRSWIVDSLVEELGHRRAIINPFLKYISFGRVDGKAKVNNAYPYCSGMVLKVYFDQDQDVTDWKGDYVAYPQGNYPPAFFSKSWYLSFSAVPGKSSIWDNQNVNYSQALVEMKDESNKAITVSEKLYDNIGAGVPNNIKWKAAGLVEGTKYFVTIKNVVVNGTNKDYTYWFKLTNETAELPSAPALVSPFNNTDTNDINLTLKWNDAPNADSYHVQVSTSNTFATNIVDKSGLTDKTLEVKALLENTQYYWRVASVNNAGQGAWSAVWGFKTKTLPLAAPVMLVPVNEETNVALKPVFKWNKHPKASSYHLQVSKLTFDNPATMIDKQVLSDTSYTDALADFKPLTRYYWRTRAIAQSQNGLWSEAFAFVTGSGQSVGDISFEDENILSNYPNPFSDNTVIVFNLRKTGNIRLSIYNSLGSEVGVIASGEYLQGEYRLTLNSSALTTGTYYCRLSGEGFSYIRLIDVVR